VIEIEPNSKLLERILVVGGGEKGRQPTNAYSRKPKVGSEAQQAMDYALVLRDCSVNDVGVLVVMMMMMMMSWSVEVVEDCPDSESPS